MFSIEEKKCIREQRIFSSTMWRSVNKGKSTINLIDERNEFYAWDDFNAFRFIELWFNAFFFFFLFLNYTYRNESLTVEENITLSHPE